MASALVFEKLNHLSFLIWLPFGISLSDYSDYSVVVLLGDEADVGAGRLGVVDALFATEGGQLG